MICPHCGYPNPNDYHGLCKSCRKPLEAPEAPKKVEKKKSIFSKSTGKAAKKSAKK